MPDPSPPVALIHGYQFDPDDPKHDPEQSVFAIWRHELGDRRVVPYAWYSAPPTLATWFRGLAAGHWQTYAWAYKRLAPAAADELGVFLGPTRHDILCHSLGSRVALRAIGRGAPVRNCVILNGAELTKVAQPIARSRPDVRFVNIYAETDAVIDHLAELRFATGIGGKAIGNDGVKGLGNWTDVVLDDPETRAWALEERGWDLRGDNPRRFTDHWYSYQHPGNWPLIRAALDGDSLDELQKGRARKAGASHEDD